MDPIIAPISNDFDPTFFYVFVAAYFLVLLCAVFYAVSHSVKQDADLECGPGCHVEKSWLPRIRCTPYEVPPPSYAEVEYGTADAGLQTRCYLHKRAGRPKCQFLYGIIPDSPSPRRKMNIFTRHATAPISSPTPASVPVSSAAKPLTSRTSWSLIPLASKAKAATFPSILPRSKSSPNSSRNSSTTTLVNQEVEGTKLTLAEEWAMAPQWRRDAAKRRVRAMRIWLGIIKMEEDEGEEGFEMDVLKSGETREEERTGGLEA